MGIPADTSRIDRVRFKGLIKELAEGATSLAEMDDVVVGELQGNEKLKYDQEIQKFVFSPDGPSAPSAGVLDSVTTSFTAAANNPQSVNPGTIIWLPEPAYQSSNPPIGYMHASGGTRVRLEYPDLFNAIGTSYGAGDGTTTFGIPDTTELDNPYGNETYKAYVRTGVVSALTGALLSGAVGGNIFRTYSVSTGNVISALSTYTLPFTMSAQAISANGAYGSAYVAGTLNGYQVLRRLGSSWNPCTVSPDYGGNVNVAVISKTGNWLLIGGALGTFIYKRTGDTTFGDPQQIDTQVWQDAFTSVYFNDNDTAVIGFGGASRLYRLSVLQDNTWTSAVTVMTTYTTWPDAAFNPVNSMVAATVSNGIQVYSRVGNALSLVPGAPAGQGGSTTWVDFSADGQYLICGAFQSWTPGIRAWKLQDQNFTPITVDDSVTEASYNPGYMSRIPGRSVPTWTHGSSLYRLTISNDTVFATANDSFAGQSGWFTNNVLTSGFIPA
jgi:hypothetical protein